MNMTKLGLCNEMVALKCRINLKEFTMCKSCGCGSNKRMKKPARAIKNKKAPVKRAKSAYTRKRAR